MIVKREEKNGILILYVKADKTDAEIEGMMGTAIKAGSIPLILREDADVYVVEDGEDNEIKKGGEDGEENDGKPTEERTGKIATGGIAANKEPQLLLRFRKAIIPEAVSAQFYDAVIGLARQKTSNRGTFQGQKGKYIMSNIFGFMDGWSANQKRRFKELGMAIPKPDIRPSRFNIQTPDKFELTLPFLRMVDKYYRELVPDRYSAQKKKAVKCGEYSIPGTAFTTITLNLNHMSRLHTDKGDDEEGFGNLCVIEHGAKYKGGETCFPKYGVGVDVRTGDIAFMNVHEAHCNTPIEYLGADSQRLSIVCYLRKRIWSSLQGMTRKNIKKHNRTIKKYYASLG